MATQSDRQSIVVLLVEDEPLVRMFGTDVLEDAGFAVVEAANGDEALVLLESRADIRVLFTDVDMPGSLNGFQLARLAKARWPHVGVLIVSGQMRPGPGDMPEGGHFVGKPYQPAAIVRLIEGLARRAA